MNTSTSVRASGSVSSTCHPKYQRRNTADGACTRCAGWLVRKEASEITGTSRGAGILAGSTVREFHQQGFVILRSIVPTDRAQYLRELIERRYRDLKTYDNTDRDFMRGDVSLMRVFEYHQEFRNLLTMEPVIGLVEQILGTDCHVVAQNALRTPRGKGIVNWHIDDELFFPFLAHLPVIPEEAGFLPCYSLNVMVALTDVEAEKFGPTQVVARSHLTGRVPEYKSTLPSGVVPTSFFVHAGDVYLVNSQTWHRGAQNQSERTRYLLTSTYGRRFISQRFFPFLNYRMPSCVLDGASDRLLRLLGKHKKGPYG
ncbi:MAG: phytanoyl-CoA dioxygenase family protein [Pseudonocardiaceae bacterium]